MTFQHGMVTWHASHCFEKTLPAPPIFFCLIGHLQRVDARGDIGSVVNHKEENKQTNYDRKSYRQKQRGAVKSRDKIRFFEFGQRNVGDCYTYISPFHQKEAHQVYTPLLLQSLAKQCMCIYRLSYLRHQFSHQLISDRPWPPSHQWKATKRAH